MNTTPTESVQGFIPNLDTFTDPQDLKNLQMGFKHVASIFTLLASYAETKAHAMQCRLDGKIDMALKFERACEAVYVKLPEWAKW